MITHAVELLPFTVPSEVLVKKSPGLRQNGFLPNNGIPLGELSNETLEDLCEAFKREVFETAMRQRNAEQGFFQR